ncbi:EAL domain-containing protein [Paraglaciecola sp. 2405UD69-4]|uniref:sensor domain-containing protein n=1 Tax=Paraglaciecola sp. 2405UD69-4 TaxID=3391836 RepID=UPI0039C9D6A7
MIKNIFHQVSRTLVNVILIVVFTLGVVVTAVVYFKGESIAEHTAELISQDMPTYDQLYKLDNYIVEQERLLFEAHSINDIVDAKDNYIKNYQSAESILAELTPSISNKVEIQGTAANLQKINDLAYLFFDNLAQSDPNWQLATTQLDKIKELSDATKYQIQILINGVDTKARQSKSEIFTGVESVKLFVVLYGIATLIIAYVVAKAITAYLGSSADNQRLSLFPTRNPNPVISLDHQNRVTYANPATDSVLQRLGLPIGQAHLLLDENIKSYQEKILADTGTHSTLFEYQIDQLYFQCNLHCLEDYREWDIHLTDITERKRIEEALSYRASHDPETGLKNRYELERTVSGLCDLGQEFSFGLVEIRSFNQLLTGQGVNVAATIMSELAAVIREVMCGLNIDDCSVYHLGEKSFALVRERNANKEQIYSLVKRIEEKILNTRFHCQYEVSLDFGFSCFPEHGDSYTTLHKSALAALDKSASSEDRSHIIFTPQLGDKLRYQQKLIEDMRLAISNADFELYFQPQLDLHSGKIIGAEVLIRWQRNGDWISPAEFIPLAERAGLIDQLGDWILQTSCEKARDFIKLGFSDIVVAVNISPLQFGRKDFLSKVQEVLQYTQLPPQNLELEITEGVIIYNEQETIATLESLKSLGVKLAIDDFGTGYSSLSYLKKFNIDKLKIDQSFVRNIQHESADQSIVRTIIELGRNLDLTLIAEGVEEQEQLNILKSMGCDEIQGYFFSRPLPELEFIEFIQQQSGS